MSEELYLLGSTGSADYFDYLADMPKKYFQNGVFEGALNISGETIAETILVGTSACHACVIACGRVVKLEDGEKRKGPEYETLVGFGPNLWFNGPVRITQLGELCDRYGIDTISVSNTIGLALKMADMGAISKEDADGISLEWGNADTIAKLIHQTAHQQGLGSWIARGSHQFAKRFGHEDVAVQANGLELPYHDPRGSSGMALVYATSPRGACHNQFDYFLIDIGQVITDIGMKACDRQGGAETTRNVTVHQNWRMVFNSLVICVFANIPPYSVLDLVNSSCCLDWSLDQLLRTGERDWNLKRIINNRLGLTRKNDSLPKVFSQPYDDYPAGADGYVPDFDRINQAYYEVRGWDPVSGFPTKEKLASLDLNWVVEDIC